jgi:hypothetical protein
MAKKTPDFYCIGVLAAFFHRLRDEPSTEQTLIETLEMIVPTRWPSPAIEIITKLLGPWIEKLKI